MQSIRPSVGHLFSQLVCWGGLSLNLQLLFYANTLYAVTGVMTQMRSPFNQLNLAHVRIECKFDMCLFIRVVMVCILAVFQL